MANYEDLVIKETRRNRKKSHGIPFTYSNKLMKYLNPMRKATYYAVGGRPSAGKRSFVDLHFVMGAFIWWYQQPVETRPPLKIIYYNMNKSPQQKLQKMLCTYLWIYFQKLMDTNTLNGMSTRMYGINDETEAEIQGSTGFFNELFKIMDIRHGVTNPTGIFNDVVRYMDTVGEMKVDGFDRYFEYSPAFHNQITLVIVDDVKRLKTESKEGVYASEPELHNKMHQFFIQMRDVYGVSPVAIVPSWEVGGAFRLNQMIPDFRELKYYFDNTDVVLHLFNPFKFQIDEYQGYKSSNFVSKGDNTPRLRICSILRNVDGVDSTQSAVMFVPENGMFFDLPGLNNEVELEKWIVYCQNFKTDYINLYNKAV
jgi:hypothetical protein